MLLFLFGLLLSVESAVNQTVAVLYQSKMRNWERQLAARSIERYSSFYVDKSKALVRIAHRHEKCYNSNTRRL